MFLNHLLNDVRFGLRLLWKSPGFTAVAVAALALGIGANTAIFSVVYATLLAPLPYPDPDRLVMVWSRVDGSRNVAAAGVYLDWKGQSRSFQDLNAWTGRSVSLSSTARPEHVQAAAATPGFLGMMGHRFLEGRDFRPEEGQPGRDQAVVLTYRFWRERFGGDRTLVGREVRIDGKPHTVVGILAEGPADRMQNKLYVPLAFAPDQVNRRFHWLLVMGRLKPGVSLEQANAEMAAVAARQAQDYPDTNKGWTVTIEPLQNNFLSRETVSSLWLLLGAVGFVLLIACANVANLLLARATARAREIAVRTSLGAGRRRLVQQLLTESVLLAGLGGAAGVALAVVLIDVILAAMPPYTLPSEADVRLSVPVLLFTLLASVLSGVLFGCVPAWQATRMDLNETLKEEGRSSSGGRRHRLRRALVVGEVALALTLLAGGGLAVHSLVKLMNVDLGFERDRLLTFYVPVPSGRLPDGPRIEAFYRDLLGRVEAVPGVVHVSASTGLPLLGNGFGMSFHLAGQPVSDPSKRPNASFDMVTPGYFQTIGLQFVRGRALNDQDREGTPRVAVVNEELVRRYLAGKDPLGQRLLIEQLIPGVTGLGPAVEWEIVGVYRNVRNDGLRGDDNGYDYPEINIPFWQSPWPQAAIGVRTAGDPEAVRNGVAAALHAVDPELPMADVKTMDQIVRESLAGDRFGAILFGAFAALALLLSVFGIYGVMSFAVAQRTHEIGLRMALGAERRQVVALVLREGAVTALIGIALGTLGGYAIGRAMQGLLFRVGAFDPLAFGTVAVTLLLAALLACLVPARRAASVDPMTALRQG